MSTLVAGKEGIYPWVEKPILWALLMMAALVSLILGSASGGIGLAGERNAGRGCRGPERFRGPRGWRS